MSLWSGWMAFALPALLFTIIGLALRRASRDPKTPRGDAVLVDLCLGMVAVVAAVFWFRFLSTLVF